VFADAGILGLIRSSAEALADEDIDAARASRQRMLARLTALEKATFNVFVGMLGEQVKGGLHNEHSLRVARVLDGLANSSCRRLTALLAAAERRTTAVAIENAFVRVGAE